MKEGRRGIPVCSSFSKFNIDEISHQSALSKKHMELHLQHRGRIMGSCAAVGELQDLVGSLVHLLVLPTVSENTTRSAPPACLANRSIRISEDLHHSWCVAQKGIFRLLSGTGC
jgi:hypothetical protein